MLNLKYMRYMYLGVGTVKNYLKTIVTYKFAVVVCVSWLLFVEWVLVQPHTFQQVEQVSDDLTVLNKNH